MNSNARTLLLHLAPNDPEPLHDQLVRQLRDRITRGEMEAGDRLPVHRTLARQHRVAPSTVEAAYATLEQDGLLTGAATTEPAVARLSPDRRRRLTERLQLEHLVQQELGKRELEMARDVQRRLLPPSELDGRGWRVAARCQPARVVAGDFFDVLHHADDRVDVVVSDVAGKGFAASLIMASVKAMLPFVATGDSVAGALSDLNRRLAGELGRGEFVALSIARYRPAQQTVELANAGAPDPYILRADQPPMPLSVPGPRLPLGIRSEVAYASSKVELSSGARLLMLTDGLPEARTADGEPLGYHRLEEMLTNDPFQGSPGGWLSGLFDRVQQISGRLPEDDWTAAVLTPTSNGGELS